jgi:hypothetical protein
MKEFTNIIVEERRNREQIDIKTLCSFGISALDDSCQFIMANDLIVIGADSGAGKSELALDIAMFNAQKGKRIALFYLEGGHEEAVARIKWKMLCSKYFGQHKEYIENFDYVSWRTNQIKNSYLKTMEDDVEREIKSLDNFWIYPVEKGFTVDNLYASLLDFHTLVPSDVGSPFEAVGQVQLDLIVVDHLQYFELNGNEQEIVQTTRILRRLKEISDIYRVPVILVSHLRKKVKDRGLPDQEDFYGSSNIVKISTTAIVLSADSSKEDFSDNLYPTFIRIVKSRIGIRSNYAIRINFDLTKRRYELDYEIFFVKDGNIFKEPVPYNKWPKWAIKKHITHDMPQERGWDE